MKGLMAPGKGHTREARRDGTECLFGYLYICLFGSDVALTPDLGYQDYLSFPLTTCSQPAMVRRVLDMDVHRLRTDTPLYALLRVTVAYTPLRRRALGDKLQGLLMRVVAYS